MPASFSVLLDISRGYRKLTLKKLEALPEAKWHRILPGQKNHVAWQVAHLAVSPANLTYARLGMANPLVSQAFVDACRRGGDPEKMRESGENYGKQRLLPLFLGILDQLEKDYPKIASLPYAEYETSTGFALRNLDEAFAFSVAHDAHHCGVIGAMLRTLDADGAVPLK